MDVMELNRHTAAPPVLRGNVPVLGMLPALNNDPLAVFVKARALGDIVRLAVPGRHPIFVIAHPDHIRHVLQDNHGNYRRTPFHDRLKIVLGDGLATGEGELWKRQRQLPQPAFRAERIRHFVDSMVTLSNARALQWTEAARTRCSLDISREMSELTLSIIVRCMFGQESSDFDTGISVAVQELQEWLADRFWSIAPDWTEWLPTRRTAGSAAHSLHLKRQPTKS